MPDALRSLLAFKLGLPIVLLAVFWIWETRRPLFGWRGRRLWHAVQNLVLAVFNSVVLASAFGVVTVLIAGWTTRNHFGLLNSINIATPVRFAIPPRLAGRFPRLLFVDWQVDTYRGVE